jgi:thiol:disulfide interchange protein DsbD
MDTLRRFMAFPMWATVVWLVWVLGHQSGVDSAGSLLALLLATALLVWSLQLPGRSRWVLGSIAALVCLGLAGTVGRYVIQTPERSAPEADTAWQTWAPGRVEAELLAGRPVFVDFTAAWCITCQYNKKTTLSRDDVLSDFAAKRVTLLRADWTRRDPAITQALKNLGRSGVPVYVLYQSGRPPVVLSEILSAQELRDALNVL